ncbi:MAG: hypothetical protein QM802_25510 [Agriterribacter sp.]
MVRLIRFIFIAGIVCIFWGCDPCDNLDCTTDKDLLQFRLVDTSGHDLVFGSEKKYDPQYMKVYSLKGSDTVFYPLLEINVHGTGYDTVLLTQFSGKVSTAYIRLSEGDIDTLQLTYNTYDTKCCGTITDITQLRLNDKTDLGGSGTQTIVK